MTVPIPDAIVDRLAKICGLLGSNQDGERSAAAYQATKILQEHRLTWRDVIEAAGRREAEQLEAPDWREQLTVCASRTVRLTEWECRFLAQLVRWGRRPSEKQLIILARIYAKVAVP